MTLSDDLTRSRGGLRAFLGRRLRDAIVLAAGAILALPLIVPFA
ncbi:hypothetical protein [Methylobacterium sp. Leaf118]|nr:hypothetical protein [Methylobacterium sp. Leaf118]